MFTYLVLGTLAFLVGAAVVLPNRPSRFIRLPRWPGRVRGDPDPDPPTLGPGRTHASAPVHAGLSAEGFMVEMGADRVAIVVRDGLPKGLAFGRRTAGGQGGTATGDSAFDAQVRLEGEPVALAASLSADARVRLLGALQAGATAKHGRIEASFRAVDADSAGRERLVSMLTELAGALVVPTSELPRALLTNGREDPVEAVRHRSLVYLLDAFRESPEAGEGARLALGFDDPGLVLAGAARLGGEQGFAAARRIAMDSAHGTTHRLAALELVGRDHAATKWISLFERTLGVDPDSALALQAVDLLGRLGGPDAVQLLRKLASGTEAAIATRAAVALGRLGDRSAEPALTRILGGGELADRIAAALALRECGSSVSIEALEACTGRRAPAELRAAAAEALEAIRARLGEIQPGGLSLVELQTQQGGLSVVSEAGGVSLTDEDRVVQNPAMLADAPPTDDEATVEPDPIWIPE